MQIRKTVPQTHITILGTRGKRGRRGRSVSTKITLIYTTLRKIQ